MAGSPQRPSNSGANAFIANHAGRQGTPCVPCVGQACGLVNRARHSDTGFARRRKEVVSELLAAYKHSFLSSVIERSGAAPSTLADPSRGRGPASPGSLLDTGTGPALERIAGSLHRHVHIGEAPEEWPRLTGSRRLPDSLSAPCQPITDDQYTGASLFSLLKPRAGRGGGTGPEEETPGERTGEGEAGERGKTKKSPLKRKFTSWFYVLVTFYFCIFFY